MPSANLSAYLAKNYLTASKTRDLSQADTTPTSDFQDSTRPKKKRRKDKDKNTQTGLIVADDNEELSLSHRRGRETVEDEDNATPTYDTDVKSAEFRKKKGGMAWKVVSTGAEPVSGGNKGNEGDIDEADRILAQAAEESRLRQQGIEEDDAPAIVDDIPITDTPRMQSGAKAGLQTAADTAALIAREERERDLSSSKKSKSQKSKATDQTPVEDETIYRDATGRRIDISLKRAEARAAADEKIRAERKAKEDAMGDVQRRQVEERKKELEEAKYLTLGRSADDEVMNDELKERVRWDDPMAGYIAQKRAEETSTAVVEGGKGRGRATDSLGGSGGVKARKKTYSGPPAAPNRYGILPGWRWDGVDRSSGFEKEWFQARSRKGRVEELTYQWQMDE